MNQVTMDINGMKCGMCEAHICDTIRRTCPDAKKVKANKSRKLASFLTETEVNKEELQKAINETGYTCVSVTVKPYVRHGLLG